MVYKVAVASIASRKSLAIARSLKISLEARVVGVSHRKHPFNYSRLFDEVITLEGAQRGGEEWGLAVADAASKARADIILPVDFLDVVSLSKISLRSPVPVAAPSYESVAMASDKAGLSALLSSNIVPASTVVGNQEEISRISNFRPPLVVKGLSDASSPEFYASAEGASKAAMVRAPCLVQEYVPGRGRGYEAVAFRGEPLLEFTHERIVEYDPGGGASLGARGPILDPRLYRLGRLVLRRLQWTGPLMVETKWVPAEGRYYVVELNPKFWGSLDLPVSLGYHFPAVLVKAVLEGPEAAREFAKGLMVRRGEFYWVLDGIRYLAKVPSTWLFMAKRARWSDVNTSDPVRVALQLAVAVKKLDEERKMWIHSIRRDYAKLRFYRRLFEGERPLLILDFDGVIVRLKVDWKLVYRALEEKGFRDPWETIIEMFHRLWLEDRDRYMEASRIVEGFESRAHIEEILHKSDLEGLDFCVASMQPSSLLKRYFGSERIYGRDSGFGPRKSGMFRACVEEARWSGPVVVLDDDLYNCVVALRMGFYPVRVVQNAYKAVESMRLGILPLELSSLRSFLEGLKRLRKA